MSPEEQAKVVELIEAVIGADGVVEEEERAFLQRVIDRFGLSREGHDGGVTASDPGRATLTLRNLGPDTQMRVMALLVDAAVADGRVTPEEHALLLASAATLGIDAAALEERIARRLKSGVAGPVASLQPKIPT
jgi:tellurite resistance protein